MPGFTDYLEALVLNWLRGNAMPAAPTAYVGLFIAAPGEAGGGTEATTTVRPAGRPVVTFGVPANGAIANSAQVSFGVSAGAALVTHLGVFDAAAGGNLLAFAALAVPMDLRAGISSAIAPGDLAITLD